ncbi:MAG: TPM domain-containing protein [Treponema sp.]|nr:TPM domain-containing protein [Treponema sp.]
MKKFLLLSLCSLFFVNLLFAQDTPTQEEITLETPEEEELLSEEEVEGISHIGKYVFDHIGILSDSEFESLEENCASLKLDLNFGFYIVCVDEPYETNIEDYAERYYLGNNLGVGPEQSGILLIMNFAERDYDIEAYGSDGHKVYTDFRKEMIANYFKPSFKNDNWYEGFMVFLQKASDYYYDELADIEKARAKAAEREYAKQNHKIYIDMDVLKSALFVGFGIALFIALATVFTMKAKMKSVHIAKEASNYIPENGVTLTLKSDSYTHSTTRVIHHESTSSKSGTSISSRGFSHSSGKF